MLKENETPENQDSAKSTQPNAYRVEDKNDLEEKDLKRTYLFGKGKMKSATDPGMEGQGMGGHNFGKNNLTPAGNDEANPPEYAGEGNAYFRRTQPAEEHPEDENFVTKDQEGEPGKNEGQPTAAGESPREQKTPNAQEKYREGTADDDGSKKQH